MNKAFFNQNFNGKTVKDVLLMNDVVVAKMAGAGLAIQRDVRQFKDWFIRGQITGASAPAITQSIRLRHFQGKL